MSLYSHDEVCAGCKLAEFISGDPRFARCSMGHEDSVDNVHGTCPYREDEGDGSSVG